MITFTIPGTPVAKGRPRMRVITSKFTKKAFAVMYSPKETVSYENLVKTSFRQVHCGALSEHPIKMGIQAFFPIPASATKRFKAECEHEDKPVIKKPDFDNIAKAICDALNQIAFKDDSQVYDCHVQKFYSDNPRTVVTIENIIELKF